MSNFDPVPDEVEKIAKEIVDSAFHIHETLGPGLLERVYEVCLCHELEKRGISYQRQVNVQVIYDGIEFNQGYRLDLLVDNKIIVELKAVENYNPVWMAQLLSYLKITNKRLGLIINFNTPLIKDGIKRVVL
jgi:GxxExxY protein